LGVCEVYVISDILTRRFRSIACQQISSGAQAPTISQPIEVLHGYTVLVYPVSVIVSFGDGATEDVWNGRASARARRFGPDVLKTVRRKLDMVEAAHVLDDLRVPPGNRLEALKGDLKGLHGIRVNDQWRIVFRWVNGAAEDVRITDYH
jgi:proteic killer suppression protein